MLTAESIKGMKSTNVSANGELTKERAKEVLKGSTRAQKNDIDALAGLKRVSINRVYATGSISAKIAIAIAQVLNIDPYYLTGEKDERGECDDMTLDAFLIEKGYAELSKLAASKKRKPRGKAAAKQAAEAQPAPAVEETASSDERNVIWFEAEEKSAEEDNLRGHFDMTEEEAVQLLRALYLRAQFSTEAAELLEHIQILLS